MKKHTIIQYAYLILDIPYVYVTHSQSNVSYDVILFYLSKQ